VTSAIVRPPASAAVPSPSSARVHVSLQRPVRGLTHPQIHLRPRALPSSTPSSSTTPTRAPPPRERVLLPSTRARSRAFPPVPRSLPPRARDRPSLTTAFARLLRARLRPLPISNPSRHHARVASSHDPRRETRVARALASRRPETESSSTRVSLSLSRARRHRRRHRRDDRARRHRHRPRRPSLASSSSSASDAWLSRGTRRRAPPLAKTRACA